MNMFKYNDIKQFLKMENITGDKDNILFNKALPFEEADEHTIIWFKGRGDDVVKAVLHTKAKTIICSDEIQIAETDINNKCLIHTNNPKLLFSQIVDTLFVQKINKGIHPTAVISDKAIIGAGTEIGAYTVIDQCIIGKNCKIGNNCHLEDNTIIGDNVVIGSCCVIGSCGYGFSRTEDGSLVQFPHIGGVIIEDDVEIGTNTSIDKGALGNTIIKKGAKIDNLVIIAHNVMVGEHTLVIGGAILCGSSRVGNHCWIAPGACIRNGISVGDKAIIGLGAIVTKNVPAGETWVGNPAKPIQK